MATLSTLMCGVASETFADVGSLSGRVTDTKGKPVQYANVIVVGTLCGAMTDQLGDFMIPVVPVGEHSIMVKTMGYLNVEQHGVVVKSKWSSNVSFSLKQLPTSPVDSVPRWKPKKRGKTPAQNDSLIQHIAEKTGVIVEWPVDDRSLPVVQWRDMEFRIRYSYETDDDSTVVRIFCERTNISNETISEQGAISFVELPYRIAPDIVADYIPVEGKWKYPIPILEVLSQKDIQPVIEYERSPLAPGDTTTVVLRFAYETKVFEKWPGEVRLRCLFVTFDTDGEREHSGGIGALNLPIE